MATENREHFKRFVDEVINGRDLSVIDETVTEDFLYMDSAIGIVKGRDGLKEVLTHLFSGFPDLYWTVDQVISESDTLVSRYSWTGTHEGEYRSIPATHEQATVQGVSINRIRDGKLAETRMLRDDLGLLRQLGLIPEDQDASRYPGSLRR